MNVYQSFRVCVCVCVCVCVFVCVSISLCLCAWGVQKNEVPFQGQIPMKKSISVINVFQL